MGSPGGCESFGKEPTKRGQQEADRREAAGTGRMGETEGKEGRDGTGAPHPLPHPFSPLSPPGQGAGAAERHKRPSALPCLGAKKIFPETH